MDIGYARVKLTRGQFALVDEADFEWLNQWKWSCHNSGYATRSVCVGTKELTKTRHTKWVYKTIKMHRLIMNTPDGMETDHINGNKLDNRRSNLRIATKNQNMHNSKKPVNNKSGYKGMRIRPNGKWQATIAVNNKDITLGTFETPEQAAHAYDEAALKYHGEYARLNDWRVVV